VAFLKVVEFDVVEIIKKKDQVILQNRKKCNFNILLSSGQFNCRIYFCKECCIIKF